MTGQLDCACVVSKRPVAEGESQVLGPKPPALKQTASALSKRAAGSLSLGALGAASTATEQGHQPTLLNVELARRLKPPFVETVPAQGIAAVFFRRFGSLEG